MTAMLCNWRTVRRLSSYTPVALSSIRIPGTRADDAPILFLHGLFGNKNNWKSIARRVAEGSGRTTFCLDLRNHGDSPHTDADSSVTLAMAADVMEFLKQEEINRCTIVGHSMGGRVALQFSYLHPDLLEKIIAVDVSPVSMPSSVNSMGAYVNAMERVVRQVSPDDGLPRARKSADDLLSPVIPEKLVRDFLIMNLVKDEDGMLRWKFNLTAMQELVAMGRIREVHFDPKTPCHVRAVFIHGHDSDFVPESDYPKIRKIFPNSTFVSVADAGHYLHVEKQSEFMDHLLQQLK